MKLTHYPTQLWSLLKRAVSAWSDDYAPSMGAALSYYTVFSLAPVLLIVIAVAGLVFGQDAARGALFEQIADLMGSDASGAIEDMLNDVSKPTQGVFATLLGLVLLLIGATTVFGELQDALDRIWRAPQRDRSGGVWRLLRTRLLSFGMVLGVGFLLIVSLVLSAAVSALGKWWSPLFGGWEVLAQALTFILGLVVTTLGFAMIYKLMPRVKVEWRDVWIGAGVTALMFSLGRFLIGLYIGKSEVASGFGAAGSLAIIFVWVYYSAQIFLLGAEFTWAYATTYGSKKDLAAEEGTPPSKVLDEEATSTDTQQKLPTVADSAGVPVGQTMAPLVKSFAVGVCVGVVMKLLARQLWRRAISTASH
ncbi:MAG: YihY/virulence factor BrkB family protein [Pseudomonadota bacterium]